MPHPLTATRPAVRGVAWMLIAQVLFSGMNIFTRLGARGVPWPETAFARFFFGAIITCLVGLGRGVPLRVTKKKLAWSRSICGTLAALTYFYILSSPKIPVGDAVTLTSVGPIFVVLLSWPLLGERVGRLIPFMAPVAFGGVLLVVKPSFDAAAPLAAVAVGGAFFYALAMLSLRRLGPGESSEAVVLHFSVFGTCVLLIVSLPVWVTPDATTLAYLALVGLTGGLAQLAMTRAFSLDRAARISPLNYLGIIITNLLAMPVFGDVPGAWQIAGSAMVIAAGTAITVGAHRESATY